MLVFVVLAATAGADELSSPTTQLRASQGAAEDGFVWDWSARLFGRGVSDGIEESRTSGVNLLGQVSRSFGEHLDVGAAAWVRLETGSTHSLYEINRVQNGIMLDEAYANFHALPGHITLSAGALNQRFLGNPLLIDEVSFPAVHEKFTLGGARANVSLVLQQALPTSTSLSTRTANKEPLPYLFTETLMASFRLSDSVDLNLRAGHFSFHDLPAQVAFDSASQGNLVDPTIPESAYFLSAFEGFHAGGDLGVELPGPLAARVGGEFLRNTEAPSKYQDGLLAFARLDWNLNARWTLSPRVEYFRNERQSSPAFYNSPDYGHNNRHGMNYEIKLARADQALAVKARYADATLIETDAWQENSKIFMVFLEMSK